MLGAIIAVLAVWCCYNSLMIRHNERQDRRGDIIDRSTVKILQIHCRRLDRLEHELNLKPLKEDEEIKE